MSTVTEHVVRFLLSWRWLLLAVAGLAALLAIGPARHVSFDRSIENMFVANDPVLKAYRKLKRTFGGNEIVLAVYVDPDLLNPDQSGIVRLARVGDRCSAVPGVRAVLTIERPIGPAIVSQDDVLASRTRQLFEHYTHGADHQTAAVVCMLDADQTKTVDRRSTVDQLRAIVESLPTVCLPVCWLVNR